MYFIDIGDSLINFNPSKVKYITIRQTDAVSVLTIKSLSKYFDDVEITFQDHEEARTAFDAITEFARASSNSVIDISTEKGISVNFITNRNIFGNVYRPNATPPESINEESDD